MIMDLLGADRSWTIVQVELEPEPTISYRSAMTVYEGVV
jgi:hypothetical protein